MTCHFAPLGERVHFLLKGSRKASWKRWHLTMGFSMMDIWNKGEGFQGEGAGDGCYMWSHGDFCLPGAVCVLPFFFFTFVPKESF